MKSAAYTITTTAQKIVTSSPSSAWVYLHVEGNSTIYIGGSNVTTVNGLHTTKHTAPLSFFVPRGNELWAIVAADTADLRVLTEGA